MKGSISLVMLAIGFVAVSSMPLRDFFNDELRDLSFNRGNNDRYGDENVDSDESSRGNQIPYPNYRRNMCKALVHRAFKDYYNPINVNAINRFMTTVKRNTAQVTAETSSAVAAAESIQYGNRPIFQVMFDRIHAFESNTRVNLQNQIGRLMAGMGNGIGYILLDGVHGFDDSRKCSMMKDMFVKTFETYKEKNMNREEMAQAFRENTALHTALSNALMDDIKCLRQDVQNVVADFNNFVNVTAERPSRDVVMQIFGYLYDFSKFARHFREILCEGQIAAFKMMDSTEGTGSGNGQGGYEGYFYGQDGNQWYGYGQGGNQRYGNGQGRNQGYGNGQGRNQGYGNDQGRNQGYGNGQGRNQGYGNGQGRYQGHGNGQGGNQGYGYGQGGNQEYRYGQGSYQANGYGQGSNQYNGNGQDRYQGNGYRQAGNMLNILMNAMNKK